MNYPIVVIEWEDHAASAEWKTEKEVAASKPAICKTIGWLIHEDRRTVKVCNSLIEQDGTVGGESLILKKNIVDRYELDLT